MSNLGFHSAFMALRYIVLGVFAPRRRPGVLNACRLLLGRVREAIAAISRCIHTRIGPGGPRKDARSAIRSAIWPDIEYPRSQLERAGMHCVVLL